MPRIPDKSALGGDDSLRSGRAIPSITAEAGGENAMGMAIGRGVKGLADKVAVIAETHEKDQDALDLIRAEAHYKTHMMAQDQRYDSDPDYKTYGDRHALESKAITDDASGFIRNAKMREKWLLQKQPETENYRNRVLDKGLRLQRQEQAVEVEGALGKHATIFADPRVDDATREKALADMDASIEAARRTGLVQPKMAGKLLKDARTRAINDYVINLQNSDDPDKYDKARDAVKYKLRAMPKGMEDDDPAVSGTGDLSTLIKIHPSLTTGSKDKSLQFSPTFKGNLAAMLRDMPEDLRGALEINEAHRSNAYQAELYAKKKRGEIAAAAPPGQSRHNYGDAIDLSPPGGRWDQKSPEYKSALKWIYDNGAKYGIHNPPSLRTNDPAHFELMPNAKALAETPQEDNKVVARRIAMATGREIPVESVAPSKADDMKGRAITARVGAASGLAIDMKGMTDAERHAAVQSVAASGYNAFTMDGDTLTARKSRKAEWIGGEAPEWAMETLDKAAKGETIRTPDILRGTQQRALLDRINAAERRELTEQINGDIKRVERGQEPIRDAKGRTALDRVMQFDRTKKANPLAIRMREAKMTYEAIAPLAHMSEEEQTNHLADIAKRLGPKAEGQGDDEHFASLSRVQLKAEAARQEIMKSRTNNPAALVHPEYEDLLRKDGVTKYAPEVKQALDDIAREGTRAGGQALVLRKNDDGSLDVDLDATSKIADNANARSRLHAERGTLIEARLAAQARIGLVGSDPNQTDVPGYTARAITKREADRLLQIPKVLPDDELKNRLRAAADRAEQEYGPKYARKVFLDAVAMSGNAAAIKMAGENKMANKIRYIPNQGFLDFGGWVVRPNQGPSFGAMGEDLARPSFNTTGPDITPDRVVPQVSADALAKVKTSDAQKPLRSPNAAQEQWLIDNPAAASAFDAKFGAGTAASILRRQSIAPPR